MVWSADDMAHVGHVFIQLFRNIREKGFKLRVLHGGKPLGFHGMDKALTEVPFLLKVEVVEIVWCGGLQLGEHLLACRPNNRRSLGYLFPAQCGL